MLNRTSADEGFMLDRTSSETVFELDRTRSDEGFGLREIRGGRLSLPSSSSLFPIGSYVEVGTQTWSDWAVTLGSGTDLASSSSSTAGIGPGSVVGVSVVFNFAVAICCGYAHSRQRKMTSLQVPFPMSGNSRGL